MYCRRIDKKSYSDLLTSLDAPARARLRSCAGPLSSAWQLASPALPAERLDDRDYTVTARTLLGQDCAPAGATCQNKRLTGDQQGQRCGQPLCQKGHHCHRCAIGGGTKSRSVAVERVWEGIHTECGHQTDREVHVPEWDRFRWHCSSCNTRGVSWAPPAPCAACGSARETRREEAVLDLEVRSAQRPRLLLDVTVHHSVPGDAQRLTKAADGDGAVNKEAEQEKRGRYPAARTPWKLVPLALETCGRHGREALDHLRGLAKQRSQALEEGSDQAASALLLRWGCRLSVALHRANARNLRSALGVDLRSQRTELAAELAG